MKQYLLCSIFAIGGLRMFGQIEPSLATPISKFQTIQPRQQKIDLRVAIDLFFTTGTLKESWFAPTEPKENFKFEEFQKQALDARNLVLKLYGSYQNVRSESSSKYIATFDRRKLIIEFKLDSQGRIAGISAQ
jgi:hypothetical protein